MSDRVELLGHIAVHSGKAAGGSLPGRRAELVFAYLAGEHHRVVTQDELANALWPDTLPDSWAAALRGVMTEVRRYLEETGNHDGEWVDGMQAWSSTSTRSGRRSPGPRAARPHIRS